MLFLLSAIWGIVQYLSFHDLIDIDGDDELEIVLTGRSGNFPNEAYKIYVYSTGVTTSLQVEKNNDLIKDYRLEQNFPNPFNPNTTIRFTVPQQSRVRINIFDINGSLVRELINEEKNSGNYSSIWNGRDDRGNLVASGAYFYQIQVGDFVQAKKMMLIK